MSKYDFAPGLRLEERIDAAECEGIEARWEFGRWMLGHVPEEKKLPNGSSTGWSRQLGRASWSCPIADSCTK